MRAPARHEGSRVVVLSGAGLSKASGIPTFRDADGLWEGTPVAKVATPSAWQGDRELVRRFYDERRVNCASVLQNPGHEAVARLQHALGEERCMLVTQNVDGLLQKAGAHDVVEMHGSIWRVRCESDADHPRLGVFGPQSRTQKCAMCGSLMRPDVVWFGEVPYDMDRIHSALQTCNLFIAVGTSGVVYPAADFVRTAREAGAHTMEVNVDPTGNGAFDEVIPQAAETALPELIGRWLDER